MSTATEFLNHLIGSWSLTWQMGEVPLPQTVEAKWTLGQLFVERYFKSTLPALSGQKQYEALYHLGYNEQEITFCSAHVFQY